MIRKLKAAVLGLWLLLSGCAGVGPLNVKTAYNCEGNASWLLRPVTVDIDDSMSIDCLIATYEALMWWRSQGVNYLEPRIMSKDYLGFLIRPEVGHITVSSVVLSPGIGGETNPGYLRSSGDMVYASIVISPDSCRPDIVAHELGHALGLSVTSNQAHNPEQGTLMYWHEAGMGWRLSPCETEGVRLSIHPGPGAAPLPGGQQGLTVGARLVGRFEGR